MNKNYLLILLLLCGAVFANGNSGGNSASVKSSDDFPSIPSETESTYFVASSGSNGVPAEINALLQETEIEISEDMIVVPVSTTSSEQKESKFEDNGKTSSTSSEPVYSSQFEPTTWKSSVESSEPTMIVTTEMVPVFKVNPHVIDVDNELVQVPVQKVIQISNKNANITITVTPNSVKLADGNVTAHAQTEIIIKNGTVVAGNTKIVAPSQITSLMPTATVNSLDLKLENGKPVYESVSTVNSKVLWFLPVKMEVKSKVNAENGKLVSEQKPWWAFLITN